MTMSLRESCPASGRGGRGLPAVLAICAMLLCAAGAMSLALAQGGAPTSGNSGKLVGDGLALEWKVGGVDLGKPYFADRTWQTRGTIKSRTVTLSGVMRASAPTKFSTSASMMAYLALPFGARKEVAWRGDLDDRAGLSHELPFSLQIDVPPGRSVVLSAMVSKTGGVTDLLAVTFEASPPQGASATSSPADDASNAEAGSAGTSPLQAIAVLLAGLLAVLGALMTMSMSKIDIQDVLKALRDLIRGEAKPAGDHDQANETTQIADAADALKKAARQLQSEGKYIANASLIEKVWHGIPHLAKEALGWLSDLRANASPDADVLAVQNKLFGTSGALTDAPPVRFGGDPNWGQCGEAAEWGGRMMAEPVRKIFGPDAVFTKIALQSDRNEFGNHIANEVITPKGERYVLDMWEAMSSPEPKIYTEAEWLEKWKGHYWIGDSITVTRGDLRSTFETVLEESIRAHGEAKGFQAFRKAFKDHPGQAEAVIDSYKAHPWPIERAHDTKLPAPLDMPMPISRGRFK